MSYIGMELDAFNSCPDVGDACGLSAAQVCHGFMRMWVHVFRTKEDLVDALQVQGFMYGNERALRALTVFGFLEAKDGRFRVKGSGRLIGTYKARSKGGHAAKKNLIPGAFQKKRAAQLGAQGLAQGLAEELPEELAQEEPRSVPRLPSALTPNTQHLTPSLKPLRAAPAEKAPRVPKQEKPTDPRHAPLKAKMEEAYRKELNEEWKFDGSDAKALSSLLGRGSDEEILARWKRGLTAEYGPARRVRELEAKWGHFGQDAPKRAGDARQMDFSRGVVRAQDVPKEQLKQTGDITHRL